MSKTNLAPELLERYRRGERLFQDVDMEDESLDGQDLEGIVFDGCSLYVSFRGAILRNASFLNGGIKTCDFREADLTNARFENVCVESAKFAGAITDNVYFDNNSAYGQPVKQAAFDEWIKHHGE